ncbi:MAG: hypothetical protein ABIL58_18465 [Pseudomonadota bacterium]
MPAVDFWCRFCNRRFTRVALLGDDDAPSRCPECGRPVPPEALRSKSLFDGIAGFSALSKDTN